MLAIGAGHVVNITTTLVDSANSIVPSVLTSLTKRGRHGSHQIARPRVRRARDTRERISPGIIDIPMHRTEPPTCMRCAGLEAS